MVSRRVIAAATAALLLAVPVVAENGTERCHVDVRRVRVSLGFAGQELFIYGQAPEGTRRVVSVIESPVNGDMRLMEKGRVGPFWLGVHQYAVSGLPALYLVALSCPGGNVLAPCPEKDGLKAANRILASVGQSVGPQALATRGQVSVLHGVHDAETEQRLFGGLWRLNASLGLWGVLHNRVRINGDGMYSYHATLPAKAPEGKYRITTWFLGGPGEIEAAEAQLFVRRWGLVAWLSRLARRRPYVYAAITVAIALAAGWLAGAFFRRGKTH